MKLFFLMAIIMAMVYSNATAQVSGVVYGSGVQSVWVVLPLASVYWENHEKGVAADMEGRFTIDSPPAGMGLVFSYVGYHNDTIKPPFKQPLEVVLSESNLLNPVDIVDHASNTHIDRLNPLWTQEIGSGELQRAACCNLSESFETNASVDVNYTDAVSGAKQIQLLGLAGVYSQLMIENIPFMRGLGSAFGLEYIPGTWMNSIAVSKGTSSVLNGYESITGQINAEFKKPEDKERFFFNYYLNSAGRQEFNTNVSVDFGKPLSSVFMGHYSFNNHPVDHNNDGFRDLNTGHQINAANFWQYMGKKGLEMRWGVRMLDEKRHGGQIDGSPDVTADPLGLWTSEIRNSRAELFVKTGYVFQKKAGTSIGFINSFSWHQLDTKFGPALYGGEQQSFYSNLIWHSQFKDRRHSYDAGLSFVKDQVRENLNDSNWITNEAVAGAFAQYTYSMPEKITLMAGFRADYNSRFGWLATPRIHAKIHLGKRTTFRLSAGVGYRSPYMIPENIALLSSSRNLVFLDPQGLEQAFNYGATLVKYVDVMGKEMSVSLEYFKTDFQHQMLIDMESDTSAIYVYTLQGKSYAHNAQVEVSYPVLRRIEARAAIRWNDVRYTLPDGSLQPKPLLSQFKGLLTMSFASNMKRWQADLTAQYVGKSPLPDRSAFPSQYQLPKYSEAHPVIHLQLTRNFRHWNVYAGVENLTGFRQHHPIIASDEPYSPYFDSSVIWGPVMGQKFYAGFRVFFNKKQS